MLDQLDPWDLLDRPELPDQHQLSLARLEQQVPRAHQDISEQTEQQDQPDQRVVKESKAPQDPRGQLDSLARLVQLVQLVPLVPPELRALPEPQEQLALPQLSPVPLGLQEQHLPSLALQGQQVQRD